MSVTGEKKDKENLSLLGSRGGVYTFSTQDEAPSSVGRSVGLLEGSGRCGNTEREAGQLKPEA